MELRNLYTFLRIAELGSFTKAADDIGYAQSTITTQVKQLEKEIGFPLFERIGRKTLLTMRGKEIIDYANQMLRLENKIKNIGKTDSRDIYDTLRIGVVESIMNSLLLAIIGRYRKLYPNVYISIFPAITAKLITMLRRNDIDIAFTIGNLADVKNCVRVCSHPEQTVFLASTDHPLARRKTVALREVFGYPLIEIGNNTFLQQELYRKATERGCRVTSYVQTESSSIIINLVKQNLGIAFLPEYLIRCSVTEKKNLKILPVKDFSMPFYMHILYHENKWLTPQMEGLIELTKDYWNSAPSPSSIEPENAT